MRPDSQRFNQAQFLRGEFCRIELLLRDDDEFRQRSIPLYAERLIELAGVRPSPPAGRALATTGVRGNSYIASTASPPARFAPWRRVAETSCPERERKRAGSARETNSNRFHRIPPFALSAIPCRLQPPAQERSQPMLLPAFELSALSFEPIEREIQRGLGGLAALRTPFLERMAARSRVSA
jgi:hypothetical protein